MSSFATGLDRLLGRLGWEPDTFAGRSWALLSHGAAVTADLVPAHLALARSPAGAPTKLLGPEHGFYGVEQDMVASRDAVDPWTGAPVVSLYGDDEESLKPDPAVFDGIDLLVVDLQDVGSRYYTYAATAVWAAEAAAGRGCEVWVLDRPNPLGGARIEGNRLAEGYESFVGAFPMPVRHGLTLGELVRLEASRRGFAEAVEVWALAGWRRSMTWEALGRPWIAPSPNMPSAPTAHLYPGLCLVEATEVSEGRGTTRPFHLVGAPGVDPVALAEALTERWGEAPGLKAIPTYFKPQFQKHAGATCGGVELVVTDPVRLAGYRRGVELLAVFAQVAPEAFAWREAPYEFVTDRPAVDLLTGGETCRPILDRVHRGQESQGDGTRRDLEAWMDTWADDEAAFREERRPHLLYPEEPYGLQPSAWSEEGEAFPRPSGEGRVR